MKNLNLSNSEFKRLMVLASTTQGYEDIAEKLRKEWNATNKTTDMINWLEEFIEKWEENEETIRYEKEGTAGFQKAMKEEGVLSDELESFCKENDLPKLSADELLSLLNERLED